MNRHLSRFMVLSCLCCTALFAQHDPDLPRAPTFERLLNVLDRMMIQYQLEELDFPAMRREVEETGRLELYLYGQWLSLALQPRNLFAPNVVRTITTKRGVLEDPVTEITTFQGKVVGDASSTVGLHITGDTLSGIVRFQGEVYFLRQASRFLAKGPSALTVIYRDGDVLPEAQAVCGMARHEEESLRLLEPLEPSWKLASDQGYNVQIATEVDGEFWDAHPSVNINDLIAGYVNELDVIWKENLNLRLTLTYQNVFTTGTDPYSGEFGHGPEIDGPLSSFLFDEECTDDEVVGLWEQFRNYWNSYRTGVTRDIAILFSGNDLRLCPTSTWGEGLELFGTAGTIGAMCQSPSQSYVLMEEYTVNTAGLMAHEVGHNLGAVHDVSADCNPGGAVGDVMCGTVEAGSDTYSDDSQMDIDDHLGTYNGCLDAIYPEIRVDQNGVTKTDGSSFFFPTSEPEEVVDRTFVIHNTGPAELRIDNNTSLVSGSVFSQLGTPSASILSGDSASVTVRMFSANTGLFSGSLTIENNDSDEDPYTIGLYVLVKETFP